MRGILWRRLSCPVLVITAALIGSPLASDGARAASVKVDTTLYAEMSTKSSVVGTLRAGAQVFVELSVAGTEVEWCRVSPAGPSGRAGFVPCDALERPAIIEERPGPAPSARAGDQGTAEVSSAAANPSRLAYEGRRLSPDEVRRFESGLQSNPDDSSARTRLLGYYFATSLRVAGAGPTISARRRHILWIIQNRPEAEIAGLPESTIDPIGHALADKEGYQQARALWLQQIKNRRSDTRVLAHAAKFLQLHDKPIVEDILQRLRAAEPTDPGWSAHLGYLYALAILGVNGLSNTGIPTSVDPSEARGAFAAKARQALHASSDADVLRTAGAILGQYGAMLRASGRSTRDESAFAEELIKRAGGASGGAGGDPVLLAEHYDLERITAGSSDARTELAAKALVQWEKALANGGSDERRVGMFKGAARAAFDAGEMAKAQQYATELLALASKLNDKYSSEVGVHHGNIVLGRLALRDGRRAEAKAHLLKAGELSRGGDTLSSFGPNMLLAKDLLEAGERDVVIQYLESCKRFWTYPRNPLDTWLRIVRAGGIPNFGPNLVY